MTEMTARRTAHQTAQQTSSRSDAALLDDRRRQAALRIVGDDRTAPEPATEQRSPDEVPLYEARTSAIGGDVDDAGNRLVVWPDRVELRDGQGRIRAVMALEAIDRVEVRRRLTSATVTVTGTDRRSLELKGVKTASAGRLRDTIAGLKLTPDTGAASTPTAEAIRRIRDLAAMGLLTEQEVAEKRALLAQRSSQRHG